MADSIEKRFGLRPTLIKGRGGVFEVTHDGDLIYSKKKTGRHAEPGEVEATLASRLGS